MELILYSELDIDVYSLSHICFMCIYLYLLCQCLFFVVEATESMETVSYPIRIEITDSYANSDKTGAQNSKYNEDSITKSDDDQQSAVHPIFVLLLVLVIIFLLVVMASILVIVKIWLYRRRRSKPRKRWIVQQKMNSNTPTSMLLTDPSDSMTTCSDLNTNNSNIISSYDVP